MTGRDAASADIYVRVGIMEDAFTRVGSEFPCALEYRSRCIPPLGNTRQTTRLLSHPIAIDSEARRRLVWQPAHGSNLGCWWEAGAGWRGSVGDSAPVPGLDLLSVFARPYSVFPDTYSYDLDEFSRSRIPFQDGRVAVFCAAHEPSLPWDARE